MKKRLIEKRVYPLDFLILTALLLVSCISVGAVYRMLWGEEKVSGVITVRPKASDLPFCHVVVTGDIVYDPLTKREIGRVKRTDTVITRGAEHMEIVIDAIRRPRGRCLRTKDVWFEFDSIELTEAAGDL